MDPGLGSGKGAGKLFDRQDQDFGKWIWVAACSLVLVVSGLSYLIFGRGQVQESTTFGEVRHVTLPDGSAVTLNANSTLMWNKRVKKERRVILQGEAFFDIVHDPDRPFIEIGRASCRERG